MLFLFVFFAEIYNFALLEKEKGHQKDAQYYVGRLVYITERCLY